MRNWRMEVAFLCLATGLILEPLVMAADLLVGGDFETVDTYPTQYAHVNAAIQAAMSRGWDFGEEQRFLLDWNYEAPGALRISPQTPFGLRCVELGKGGEISANQYRTPSGNAATFPLCSGSAWFVCFQARGTGTLTVKVREEDAGGKVLDSIEVLAASLSEKWTEHLARYIPRTPAATGGRLSLVATDRAWIDSVSLTQVRERTHLVRDLQSQEAEARSFVKRSSSKRALEELEQASGAARRLAPELTKTNLEASQELALREQLAPAAAFLQEIVWTGKRREAGTIRLQSPRLALSFYGPKLRYRLAAVEDAERRVNFLSRQGSPVWRVKLLAAQAPKASADPAANLPSGGLIDSDTPCRRLAHEFSEKGRRLVLRWIGVEAPGQPNAFDVIVSVRLSKDSRLSRWRIDVANHSQRYSAYEVSFPLLTVAPVSDGDCLAVPSRLIRDPYSQTPVDLFYPYTLSLQMAALYCSRAGLYLSTEDGEGYFKRLRATPAEDRKSLELEFVHLPENHLKPGVGYKMPFDSVVGTFDGNWWQAAKIYRSWAVRQKWCAAGPLHARSDVPQWYKELPVWVLLYEPRNFNEADILDGKVSGGVAGHFWSLYGVPFGLHYYGWDRDHRGYGQSPYAPPGSGEKGFPLVVKQMQANHGRVVPYVQGHLYDTTDDWYTGKGGSEGALYFEGGSPIVYGGDNTYTRMTWMCLASRRWQDRQIELSTSLAKYGCDGVYYDSQVGFFYPCYNPAHRHPLGGGRYGTDGVRALLSRCREAAKAVNPEFIQVGESPHEIGLGILDGSLQFCFSALRDEIPLFSSVYHDYFLLWGNTYQSADDDSWAHVPVACSFVRGDQLGWFGFGTHTAASYTAYLAKLRMRALKFLALGEMMEPPTIISDLPTVTTPPWYPQQEKEPRVLPAVLSSAWKAPDGTLGLVFANTAKGLVEVRYRIELRRYAMPAREHYAVHRLTPEGEQQVGEIVNGRAERADVIESKRALLLEIKAD